MANKTASTDQKAALQGYFQRFGVGGGLEGLINHLDESIASARDNSSEASSVGTAQEYRYVRSAYSQKYFAFIRVYAPVLAQGLNRYLETISYETLDLKKKLAKWVNGELRLFGLAIRCPKTNNPSILIANPDSTGKGRFFLESTSIDGVKKRAVSFVSIPPFELMEDSDLQNALIRDLFHENDD